MSPFKEKIIGVLYGGLSKEREVSLRSGQAVLEALLLKGYDAVPIDVGRDIDGVLQDKGIDIAFLALHGRFGEDGCIQGLLEIRSIPYTGSSVMTSALAMDKYLTKDVARAAGIPTPDDFFFDANHHEVEHAVESNGLPFPLIVKPCREGSTIGITKVMDTEGLRQAIHQAQALDKRVLIERFIPGRELTVAVLNGEPLPVLEVVPETGFYDFVAKYQSQTTRYHCPASLPEEIRIHVQNMALKAYRRMGCEGVARADFILTAEGMPYFLEINTLPGMTSHSLVPKAAAAAGISFPDLVEKILLSARLKIE